MNNTLSKFKNFNVFVESDIFSNLAIEILKQSLLKKYYGK